MGEIKYMSFFYSESFDKLDKLNMDSCRYTKEVPILNVILIWILLIMFPIYLVYCNYVETPLVNTICR